MGTPDAGHHSFEPGSAARRSIVAAKSIRETYTLRLMVGYIASLLVLLGAFHFPLHRGPARLAWEPASIHEQITLQDVRTSRAQEARPLVPVTSFSEKSEDPGKGQAQQTFELQPEDTPDPTNAERRMEIPRLERAVYDFAEVMPQVVGGMRAFYINIEYPEEARRAGIEGQLILTFTVETDGTPTGIRVLRSLHPLCDSAAVRALRLTRFMPARRNGEDVRVRMRLPVRFTLIDHPASSEDSSEAPR